MDVSISFMLKNKLHLAPQDMARFRLFVALPLYFAGLFDSCATGSTLSA